MNINTILKEQYISIKHKQTIHENAPLWDLLDNLFALELENHQQRFYELLISLIAYKEPNTLDEELQALDELLLLLDIDSSKECYQEIRALYTQKPSLKNYNF